VIISLASWNRSLFEILSSFLKRRKNPNTGTETVSFDKRTRGPSPAAKLNRLGVFLFVLK